MKKIIILSFIPLMCLSAFVWLEGGEFEQEQLKYQRVRQAKEDTEKNLIQLFEKQGISYPPAELLTRIFKHEKELEVWVRPHRDKNFYLLKTYAICEASGVLGPKRKEGDNQVPEGFYRTIRHNPMSSYHLSLLIDYPNQADRILSDKRRPGGAICIHGDCVSVGCVAITDEWIKEYYWLTVKAKAQGAELPVYIFPLRFGKYKDWRKTIDYQDVVKINFWENLEEGYQYFESKHQLPLVSVGKEGQYIFDSKK